MEQTNFRLLMKTCFMKSKSPLRTKQRPGKQYGDFASSIGMFRNFSSSHMSTKYDEDSGRPIEKITGDVLLKFKKW